MGDRRHMKGKPVPGRQALRRGRVSVENTAYFLTTCTAGGRPLFAEGTCGETVVEVLGWLRGKGRIWLLGYLVMPDHVHVALVLRSDSTLPGVVKSFKGFASWRLHVEVGVAGPVWQPGFYDQAVRDLARAWEVLEYVRGNPVRKGLCESPEEYPFSSANLARWGQVDWWWLE